MLAKVTSGATIGLDATPVEVEVDVASKGLPSLSIVGLPSKAVEESRERVRTALVNSGVDFPRRRITVNLAPADIPKDGPAYDLPIAVGVLLGSETLETIIDKDVFFGELSLDGSIRHTNGVLPIAIMASEKGYKRFYCPFDNAKEAAVIKGLQVIPVTNLNQLIHHLRGLNKISPHPAVEFSELEKHQEIEFDMSDVHGQEQAKRAMEIAAAGGHNVFLNGTPGSGKTMLARTFPSILPKMTEREALEVTKIFSITGNLESGESLVSIRPFRSPHHTTSRIGLIGGGSKPMPGEISLAHRGVLFLDEFPEFTRSVLESLRQPMEDGLVSISRAAGTVKYPSRFTLVAAANPCPCGYYLSRKKACTCLPGQITRYQKRVSGPILDRIDLHVHVSEVEVDRLVGSNINVETSEKIQIRVEKARQMQKVRFVGTKLVANAEMNTKQVKEFCPLDKATASLLTQATAQLGLTARTYFKMIKVARTIADLNGDQVIEGKHIAEALMYRPQLKE